MQFHLPSLFSPFQILPPLVPAIFLEFQYFIGNQYWITTDRNSNFIEWDILTSTTARAVINKLKPRK